MKQSDLAALKEFMAMSERVRGVMVQEGLLEKYRRDAL